jgi:hypothetical protein
MPVSHRYDAVRLDGVVTTNARSLLLLGVQDPVNQVYYRCIVAPLPTLRPSLLASEFGLPVVTTLPSPDNCCSSLRHVAQYYHNNAITAGALLHQAPGFAARGDRGADHITCAIAKHGQGSNDSLRINSTL